MITRTLMFLALAVAAPAAHAQSGGELPSRERAQELLFDAARLGRTDLVPALIAAGADIDAYDPRGFTPLILAAYNNQLDTVEALLSSKADPCKPDANQGNTAQMGVAFKGYDAIAARLLKTTCAVDVRNKQGQTALMMAAMFNRTVQVDMLLSAGADPSLTDQAGRGAASVARAQGNDELAPKLEQPRKPHLP